MGIWGNILIGGAIGAIVDHSKGTGYTYPSWIQLVFGQTLSFDRHREDRGQPLQGENAHGVVVAGNPSSGNSAHGSAVTLPLASEPAAAEQADVAAAPASVGGNAGLAGPAMSTASAASRAQGISNGLQCGTVQATSATRFSAVCSSGTTVQIDCSGFRCTSTFQ
ncbi:hypothetical protein [Xanthomonas euvesicatoria]|uniref:Uncharacterized protein n=1 Tax=Xanthomonas euvesicatoria TaxID=456327 RepID=A0AAW3TZU7_XANEU|nr:hypothetical protein [Xanthomonas euvesicatoria]MBB4721820.1 hypothetical protein [Xanthomonas euvesicatoria]